MQDKPDKLKNYKPLIRSVIITVFLFLLVQMTSNLERFTDGLYPSLYKEFYPFFSFILGWIPFSIGDIIYGLLVTVLLFSLFIVIQCLLLGQKWRSIIIFSRIILWVGFFYAIFHLVWGFNYYKPSISNLYEGENYTIEELKEVSKDLLAKSKHYRGEVQEDKNGVFVFNMMKYNSSRPNKLSNSNLVYRNVPVDSKVKYSLYSWGMRYLGVAGYFNPFTGEAQVIRDIPTTTLAFSLAHEQAHQMGYASENEANFIGYLICIESDSAALQYAANYKGLKYVLREIYPIDSSFVKNSLDNFSPGMRRDYTFERIYNQKYSGKLDQAFSEMNNAYLKANNQKDGIESYNNFVELLVGYYREEGFKE